MLNLGIWAEDSRNFNISKGSGNSLAHHPELQAKVGFLAPKMGRVPCRKNPWPQAFCP